MLLLRLTGLVLFLAGCSSPEPRREWKPSDHGQPEQQEAPGTMTAAELEVASMNSLWQTQCASCHASSGVGGGPGVPSGAILPDFTNAAWQASRTDEQLGASIATGKGVMPAFAGRLTGEQIALLVRQIRMLGSSGTENAATAPTQ